MVYLKSGRLLSKNIKNQFYIYFRYGAQSLTVTKFLAAIVGLLSDATASVREAAFSTLVEIYTHIGERLRIDLQRKHQVPPAK